LSDDEPAEDLQDLYETAPCGYLSLRPDGRIAKVNQTFCTWIGKPAADIIGGRLRSLLTAGGSIFYETHFAPLLRMQGFFHEVALDLVKADGTIMPVLANAAERRDEADNLLFTRITIFKATERRRHERELIEAQAAEREARTKLQEIVSSLQQGMADQLAKRIEERQTSELREQFIAVLGHDLRNPLAAIQGGTQILAKVHSDAKSVRILGLMGESVSRMSTLIDNVMDFARGRLGGGIALVRSPGQPIEPTLLQVIEEIRVSHPDRQIHVRFELTQALDVDHARIAQLFSNLLGNAITHGAPAQPIVVEAATANGAFELAVANGGEPIPPEAVERLFQPFYRGEVGPNLQGLGLGLYIASQIAEAHGGRLEVKSDAGETRFTFRMPLKSER
jgi:sigma-B regulation protein RsbU (phosphoserine phosphatase)